MSSERYIPTVTAPSAKKPSSSATSEVRSNDVSRCSAASAVPIAAYLSSRSPFPAVE